MNRYRVTYFYYEGGGGGIEVEFHDDTSIREALHQFLVRPSIQSFKVEKL
jgi:hypothetical protein